MSKIKFKKRYQKNGNDNNWKKPAVVFFILFAAVITLIIVTTHFMNISKIQQQEKARAIAHDFVTDFNITILYTENIKENLDDITYTVLGLYPPWDEFNNSLLDFVSRCLVNNVTTVTFFKNDVIYGIQGFYSIGLIIRPRA